MVCACLDNCTRKPSPKSKLTQMANANGVQPIKFQIAIMMLVFVKQITLEVIVKVSYYLSLFDLKYALKCSSSLISILQFLKDI